MPTPSSAATPGAGEQDRFVGGRTIFVGCNNVSVCSVRRYWRGLRFNPLAWLEIGHPPGINVLASKDGGRTWTRWHRVETTENGITHGARVAVGPGGELHVVWERAAGQKAEIRWTRSLDGDRTYSRTRTIGTMGSLSMDGDCSVDDAWTDRREDAAETPAPHSGNWLMRQWIATSTEGGRTIGRNKPFSEALFPPPITNPNPNTGIAECYAGDYNGLYSPDTVVSSQRGGTIGTHCRWPECLRH